MNRYQQSQCVHNIRVGVHAHALCQGKGVKVIQMMCVCVCGGGEGGGGEYTTVQNNPILGTYCTDEVA